MIGAIIGDIAGSRFEFNNHRSKEFDLFTDSCSVTDDSIMTLAVARAILDTAKAVPSGADGFYAVLAEMTVKYLREIGRRYPRCGFGGRFYQWIFSENPQPYNSFGNGATMRISPAGFNLDCGRVNRFVTNFHHEEGRKEEQNQGKSMATVNDTTMYGCYYTWYYLGDNLRTGLCLFDRDMEILGGRFFDEDEYYKYAPQFILPCSELNLYCLINIKNAIFGAAN